MGSVPCERLAAQNQLRQQEVKGLMHLKQLVISQQIRSDILAFLLGFSAAVLISGAASIAHGASRGEPMAMVQSTVKQVVEVLKDHSTPQSQRRRLLIQLVAGHFDFADMARSSLGPHWRELKPEQRQQFVPLFTTFMEDVYLNKLERYSGQKIDFRNETSNGPGYSQVDTTVIQSSGGQPIPINYRLKKEGNDWKVYDVTVEGISITANYRNQFNRVMNNQGFETLMSEIRSKRQDLTISLGNG